MARYFRFTTDHKVVGIQYLVTDHGAASRVGGTLAMLIRTNLIAPGLAASLGPARSTTRSSGCTGIIMIIATIIMVTGPFGNFILPIMIGARDMAFPRLNALSFWLLFAAVPVLLSAFFLGGIPTGWSAYAPLSDQAPPGMDAFLVTIIMFAHLHRARRRQHHDDGRAGCAPAGMTWNRTPIFVFGVGDQRPARTHRFPDVHGRHGRARHGPRHWAPRSTSPQAGAAAGCTRNLFWLMGHPEVYVILLPAIIALLEITPVFTRKPLFSFNGAVLGIGGIVGLSLFVWAHHMYMAGWAPPLNAPFMVTTELISIPTGLLFLVLLGTLWRGPVWMRLPVMAVYALLWNFTIGGITGIYLSDVPVDQAMHGSMFVTAHFHYTLMGAALTGALGALAYWFPKMTGRMLTSAGAASGSGPRRSAST